MAKDVKLILKSTRIKRTIPVIFVSLIPLAITNTFPIKYLGLLFSIIFIYSGIAIQNAIKDKDYILPKKAKTISYVLLVAPILFSIIHIIFLYYFIITLLLGLAYNSFSRKIKGMDNLIAGLTHFSIPIIVSSILVNLETKTTIILASTFYLFAISYGPMTNLKDTKKDKMLGYKTLVNQSKDKEKFVNFCLSISIIIFSFLFYYLTKNPISLIFLIPSYLIKNSITDLIYKKNGKTALVISRIYLIFTEYILILLLTTNIIIITFTTFLISLTLFLEIKKIYTRIRN